LPLQRPQFIKPPLRGTTVACAGLGDFLLYAGDLALNSRQVVDNFLRGVGGLEQRLNPLRVGVSLLASRRYSIGAQFELLLYRSVDAFL